MAGKESNPGEQADALREAMEKSPELREAMDRVKELEAAREASRAPTVRLDCVTVQGDEMIEEYLRGSMLPEAQDLLEVHILECGECARELEVRLSSREALRANEAEIRSRAVHKSSFWRWPSLALASIVLAAAMGTTYAVFVHRINTNVPAPVAVATPPAPVPSVVPPKEPEEAAPVARAPEANRKRTEAETKLRQSGEATTIETPASTTAEMQKGETTEPGPLPDKQPERQANEKPTVTASTGLTTEQGVELFRMGQVRPPTYSFAGQASGAKIPIGAGPETYGGNKSGKEGGRVLFNEAMNEYVAGRYVEAAEGLRNARRLEPTAADVHFYLGICELMSSHPEAAIASLQEASTLERSAAFRNSAGPQLKQWTHYYLAKAHIQTGNLQEAEAELTKAVAAGGPLTSEAKKLLSNLENLGVNIQPAQH